MNIYTKVPMSGKGKSGPNEHYDIKFTLKELTTHMMLVIPRRSLGDPSQGEPVLDDVEDFLATYNHYVTRKMQVVIKDLKEELHVRKEQALRDEAALRANAEQLLIHQQREDTKTCVRCNRFEQEDDRAESDKKRLRLY